MPKINTKPAEPNPADSSAQPCEATDLESARIGAKDERTEQPAAETPRKDPVESELPFRSVFPAYWG